ncbi:MAG: hypothetical protein IMW89_01755 [Ktedonobacteraceae bacterium]|nr:hypothetical protein [Ktedonobacteraceae bacterium]
MTWKSLAERAASLPLVLAGPLVRRVEPRSVTIWLALKEAMRVTLRVYAKDHEDHLSLLFAGTQQTIHLGDHLHVIAVTARATLPELHLAWGEIYYYNLFFQPVDQPDQFVLGSETHLLTPGVLAQDGEAALQSLLYPGEPLPSFMLPPQDLNTLRLFHGSCRKPHGTGKEMLSALDSFLTATVGDRANRPQQLYLTGDQIYADDVARALLFMIMDAAMLLFSGNHEEILPLLDVPARQLAPGKRADIVRNRALLTTTAPESHLLALVEYATMYLFTWSDVLWPKTLPTLDDLWQAYPQIRPQNRQQQSEDERAYAEQVTRLEQFRATLPQVRRALAHIATYMVGDDHDVTDDWYLDGAWCRRVLESPLGRRVVRNAQIAFALFQAWGNMPEQFTSARGQEFLRALDVWRGDECDTALVEMLERAIGLPKSFPGSGELPYSEQALHWHYSFEGPRYQIIALDTRTQRLYRAPRAFPGLLSPAAMHRQLRDTVRRDVDVTVIVSPSPVLGVEFIESVQYWSRIRARDNYAYDREAWALEWSTFQHLLRTVSMLKRVVFLSGDVHYAFGSSLAYWDLHNTAAARIIDFTSSSLRNEGSSLSLALVSVGYPYMIHLLGREDLPAVSFFAWDQIDSRRQTLRLIRSLIMGRMYRFWWAIPRLLNATRSPYEIVLQAYGWPKGAFAACPPDRSYRLSYLRDCRYPPALPPLMLDGLQRLRAVATRWIVKAFRNLIKGLAFLQKNISRARRGLARRTLVPAQTPRGTRHIVRGALKSAGKLEQELEEQKNTLARQISEREGWLDKWKAGAHIVGYANLGDIRFRWTESEKRATQYLWWWHPEHPDCPTIASEYSETLELPAADEAPPLP